MSNILRTCPCKKKPESIQRPRQQINRMEQNVYITSVKPKVCCGHGIWPAAGEQISAGRGLLLLVGLDVAVVRVSRLGLPLVPLSRPCLFVLCLGGFRSCRHRSANSGRWCGDGSRHDRLVTITWHYMRGKCQKLFLHIKHVLRT